MLVLCLLKVVFWGGMSSGLFCKDESVAVAKSMNCYESYVLTILQPYRIRNERWVEQRYCL